MTFHDRCALETRTMRTTIALVTAATLATTGCAHAQSTRHTTVAIANTHVQPELQVTTLDPVTLRPDMGREPVAKTPPNIPSSEVAVASSRTFRGVAEDTLVHDMATRPVVRVIAKHHSTAVVFHVELEGGLEIAFKANTEAQPDRWRHEVIAYRLARVLGIEGRVPPAVSRKIPLSAFGRLAWGEGLVSDHADAMVSGAAIYWMPVLEDAELHTEESRRQMRHWLDPHRAAPTGDEARRASQLATVLAFDVLQGNGDRWNVGNVRVDEFNDVVLRDNDSGWFISSLRARPYVGSVKRLPRELYDGIVRADANALRAELQLDPDGGAMLAPRHFEAYDERRRALIEHINDQRAHYGDEAVLSLPWYTGANAGGVPPQASH